MNRKLVLACASLALLSAVSLAQAHGPRSRVSVGVHIGVPVYSHHHFWGPRPYWYYAAPVYVPAPVIIQQPPTVYVEQAPVQQASAQHWWYYCADSRAYYPYVKDCPAGWQRVAPQPAQ